MNDSASSAEESTGSEAPASSSVEEKAPVEESEPAAETEAPREEKRSAPANDWQSRLRRVWESPHFDHALGAAIALVYVLILVRSAHTLGYARDEGFYFDAGRAYARWFAQLFENPRVALSRPAIDAAWSVNHEHPSLMKSLFGLSWMYLHEKHKVFVEAGTAFRFPGMVFGGLSLWLVHVWGARTVSRRAGLVAAAALAFMPRFFYHSHLDCFDVPVTFFWALTAYCYWRSLEGKLRWSIATGVVWGLALNVKFNVFLLPAVFTIHWFLSRGREVGASLRRGSLPVPVPVLAMVLIGVPLFFALWPWMWFDTFVAEGNRPGRMGEYLGFHWNHAYYNMEFYGYNYFRPPFPRAYPYAMIAFTVPAVTLLLCFVGLLSRAGNHFRDVAPSAGLLPAWGARLRALRAWAAPRDTDDLKATHLLWLGAGYAALALWWKRDTPIFGGTKHWFTLYPFMALYAGAGFDACARWLGERVGDRVKYAWLPAVGLGALCVLPMAQQTAHSHPFGLSAYTPLAGGLPGAADKGMNRQFWGFTTGSLVDWFNERAPTGARLYLHDTAWPSWAMLQSDGRVREDLRAVGEVDADVSIVHHELHMNEVDYQIWQARQSPRAAHVLVHDGVPIVTVYAREGALVAPTGQR